MNSFNQYNNASVIINHEFIFDPWLYGSLYNNSWYPYGDKTLKKIKLKKIKYCFISHLHQDHWDLETIKYLPKKTIFIIPKLQINKIIEVQLRKLNFNNIIYAPIKKFTKIDQKYSISVVRPLNSEGLETKNKIYKNNNKEIDTGCIVKIKNDNSHHLLLSDNNPYNLKAFLKDYKKIKINSIFFPFNGYASDYPFCYDNFSIRKKKELSKIKIYKLQEKLYKLFKKIKPAVLIPYSSNFKLENDNKKLFYQIIDQKFFDKKKYSNFFSKKYKMKNIQYLQPNQTLYFSDNNYKIKSDNSENLINYKTKIIKSNFPKVHKNYKLSDLENDLKISLSFFEKRIKKFKLNLKKIEQTVFIIILKKLNKIYKIDFNKLVISQLNYKDKNYLKNKFNKILILKTNINIISNILNRKLHMNNCVIGLCLNWERYPNHYNSEVIDSLNFFHK